MYILFLSKSTLDSVINIGVRLLILGIFSSGYMLIKGGRFINFLIFLIYFFLLFSFGYVLENQIICHFKGAMLIVFAKCSRRYVYSRGYVYSGV